MARPLARPAQTALSASIGRGHGRRGRVFNPLQLFANGELGWWYDLADLATQFTDLAGTVPVTATGDAVARLNDKSPNGSNAIKATSSARPALKFLPSSNRPYHDYDGVDDVLSNTAPVGMGTNCTTIRLLAGSALITTGQTISGTSNRTVDNYGEIVINRPLTAKETAAVTAWANQRRGALDTLNVQYGADATNEILDIFPSSGHPLSPVFVMVHGGGWRNGDKLLDNVTFNKFHNWIRKGITCVSVNYKLDVGTDPVTVQAVSVAKGIAFIQARYPGRPVVVIGHSAGAHLVNLAMSDDGIRNGAGIKLGNILGMLLLDSAAFNVSTIMNDPTHWSGYDEPFSGGQAQWDAASPTLRLATRMPPTMCVVSQWAGPHGEDDSANTQEWIDTATALGTVVTRRDTPLAHGDLNNFLGLPSTDANLSIDPTYTADVDAWLATLGI